MIAWHQCIHDMTHSMNPKENLRHLVIIKNILKTEQHPWKLGNASKPWRKHFHTIHWSCLKKVKVTQSCLTLCDTMDFSSVQSLSHVWLFETPWIVACQASLSITNSWSLPKPMSIESVMPYNHFTFCCPLLLLPSIFPNIRVFSNESALCIRGPKYWSFNFNISLSNEQDWFPLVWTGSPCSPRDSQESSPTPQFKSINSSALSFLYSPTLTSIYDYWKTHSLD